MKLYAIQKTHTVRDVCYNTRSTRVVIQPCKPTSRLDRRRLTRQVEVLQRRLRSDGGVEVGAEALDAVVGAVDLPPGRADVVVVGDWGPGVDERNL